MCCDILDYSNLDCAQYTCKQSCMRYTGTYVLYHHDTYFLFLDHSKLSLTVDFMAAKYLASLRSNLITTYAISDVFVDYSLDYQQLEQLATCHSSVTLLPNYMWRNERVANFTLQL